MFYVHLGKKYIQLFGVRKFYIYLLSPSCLMCHSKPMFPYFQPNLATDVNKVLNSLTIIMKLLIFLFVSVNMYFIYLGPTLGAYLYLLYLVGSLYHYAMPFFVNCYTAFVLKSTLT